MSNLNKIKVVDYTMGRRSSDDVNTDIPFSDNFAKTRTIQQANVVLGAYVNRNYKDNRQWLTELENKADKDEIPEKTSDLTNDGSDGENPFITNQVDDLVNYTNNTSLNDIITPIENMLDGTKPAGNMIVDSIRSKNMFNKINLIISAYVAGWSGNLEYNANCVTGYIECEPNTTYTLSKIADKTFGYATCDHIPNVGDALSQILIEGQNVTHATITTNSTAKYILFWFYWSDQDTNSYEDNLNSVQCEKGSVATSYSPYQNLNYNEKVLYDNADGSNSNITLNESVVNYKYIEIYFKQQDSTYSYTKVANPNGKTVALMGFHLTNEGYAIGISAKNVTISGNSILNATTERYMKTNIVQTNVLTGGEHSNSVYITKVIGYK